MQLYSAIPDIAADAQARLRTTAVVIGERASLVVCTVLWLVFAFLIMFTTSLGWITGFAFVYAALPIVPLLIPAVSVEWLYWRFPWITGVLGLCFWWYVALQKLG
jgi:4-hydroxybenzoate polyprenyltransferase